MQVDCPREVVQEGCWWKVLQEGCSKARILGSQDTEGFSGVGMQEGAGSKEAEGRDRVGVLRIWDALRKGYSG